VPREVGALREVLTQETVGVLVGAALPWQNAWMESFNGRLRDEFLNSHRFDSLFEAQVLIAEKRLQREPSP
jgi:hypothetical protein